MSKETQVIEAEQEATNIETTQAEEIEAKLERIEQIIVQRESFSGPLPHPDHLKRYNQIVPGSANRLLKMAEDDLAHIHKMKQQQASIEKIATIGGLLTGWSIAMVALLGSGYLILNGHDIAGAMLGTGSLASLVGIFVYGRKSK